MGALCAPVLQQGVIGQLDVVVLEADSVLPVHLERVVIDVLVAQARGRVYHLQTRQNATRYSCNKLQLASLTVGMS